MEESMPKIGLVTSPVDVAGMTSVMSGAATAIEYLGGLGFLANAVGVLLADRVYWAGS